MGTSYEQATDEIGMTVTVNGDRLTALATFADPQMIPYKYIENLGIAAFRIVDANGRVVKEAAAESAAIVNGQASIHIRLDDIDSGSYTLCLRFDDDSVRVIPLTKSLSDGFTFI